jgi:hypothetical protein
MTTAVNSRRPALLCALILLFCAIAAFPVAEIGFLDDWSYVQSARVLAQTGHIVYNGWASPILGWQLILGALFIKLFGPSFTAIRASTLLVAMATAFLTQRTFVRAGISSRNATIGTLTLVLSPLFLPLALSFMTDIGGLFCVILCLYACLRALQAQADGGVLAWLAFAALSNALGGTVRQIAWLGVLVMFPCAVWLLRGRLRVLVSGALLYAISILFIYAVLHWFAQQPYSVPEHLVEGLPGLRGFDNLTVQLSIFFFTFALLLLPILIAFIPAISPRKRLIAAFLATGGLSLVALAAYFKWHYPFSLAFLLIANLGLTSNLGIKGARPAILPPGILPLISIAVSSALLCFFTFLLERRVHPNAQAAPVSPLISSILKK